MCHFKLSGDLPNIYRLALKREGGIPRHNMQGGDLAQISDDIFADSVAEVFLLRIAAHVYERQNADG